MSDAAQILNEAYDLIEQGKLAEARQLLDPIRADNEDNPDFWWVYAHAVESEDEGRQALSRVATLKPDYPGVETLSQEAGLRPPPPIQALRTPPPLPEISPDDFDDDFGAMDERDFEAEKPAGSSLNRLMLLGLVIVVVLVIVALLVVPGLLGGNRPTPTATIAVIGSTPIVPTIGATAAAVDKTQEVAVATAEIEGADTLAALAEQLSAFDVPVDGVQVDTTALGNTLLIATCAPRGPASTQAIINIAEVLKAETLADDVEGIGFQLMNCDSGSVSRVIGLSRSQFDDFAAGNITQQEFQTSLRPIG